MDKTLNNRQKAIIPIAAFAADGNQDKLSVALSEGLDAGMPVNEVEILFLAGVLDFVFRFSHHRPLGVEHLISILVKHG